MHGALTSEGVYRCSILWNSVRIDLGKSCSYSSVLPAGQNILLLRGPHTFAVQHFVQNGASDMKPCLRCCMICIHHQHQGLRRQVQHLFTTLPYEVLPLAMSTSDIHLRCNIAQPGLMQQGQHSNQAACEVILRALLEVQVSAADDSMPACCGANGYRVDTLFCAAIAPKGIKFPRH